MIPTCLTGVQAAAGVITLRLHQHQAQAVQVITASAGTMRYVVPAAPDAQEAVQVVNARQQPRQFLKQDVANTQAVV